MHLARSSRKRRSRRGFTLLEIIVVVTIIALLAAMVAPRLLGQVGKSKRKIAESDVQTIAQQVNLWMLNNGFDRLPSDFELELLASGDDRVLNEDELIDPWGNAYIVVFPPDVNPDFDILSFGADGQPGGEGDDADVVN